MHGCSAANRPYHGRGDPQPGITLQHIFPNIIFADFNVSYRNVSGHAVRLDGGEAGRHFVGYYQNMRCVIRCLSH